MVSEIRYVCMYVGLVRVVGMYKERQQPETVMRTLVHAKEETLSYLS